MNHNGNIKELDSLIFPFYGKRIKELISAPKMFRHYTSCESLISILKNREFWLKSVSLQDDKEEVEYCASVLGKALEKDDELYHKLYVILDKYAGCELTEEYDLKLWLCAVGNKLRKDVYITCFSETDSEHENVKIQEYMWEKYAKYGGSLVFDVSRFYTRPERNDSLFSGLCFSPIEYLEEVEITSRFKELIEKIWQNQRILAQYDSEIVKNRLMYAFIFAMVSVKRRKYKDEKEWRLVAIFPEKGDSSVDDKIYYKYPLFGGEEYGDISLGNYLEEIVLYPVKDNEKRQRELTNILDNWTRNIQIKVKL